MTFCQKAFFCYRQRVYSFRHPVSPTQPAIEPRLLGLRYNPGMSPCSVGPTHWWQTSDDKLTKGWPANRKKRTLKQTQQEDNVIQKVPKHRLCKITKSLEQQACKQTFPYISNLVGILGIAINVCIIRKSDLSARIHDLYGCLIFLCQEVSWLKLSTFSVALSRKILLYGMGVDL